MHQLRAPREEKLESTTPRRGNERRTISIAPRMTPSRIFAYTSPPSSASSGSSTKSVSGFSSNTRLKAGWGWAGGAAGCWIRVGVMERRERKATCATARESQLGLAKESEVERLRAHLRHDLADLGKVSTPPEPGPC